jgi:small subunit ribosomal protein S6
MRTYELLYIIPSKFTDKESSAIINQIEAVLKGEKINILESKPIGKKTLAYPIKHCHFGICGLIKFEGEEKVIKNINDKLRLMPEIIRYQILKYIETQTPKIIKVQKEEKIKSVSKTKKEQPLAGEIKKPAETKKEKIKLEELDKKLEEILKG